jgi:protein ImuA
MTMMLRDLRARIARIEGFAPERQARACPTGWAAVDAALPGGGLREGALHEIHSPDPADGAAMGFAARLLGRFQARTPGQTVLWASCRADLFAPGLLAAGADPGRLLMARCRDAEELLFAFEEGLKSKALAAVFGEIGELDFALSRRLQLAAADAGATLILLRPARFGAAPSAAVTRWRAEACPGGWSLTLFRCRGGRPGHWRMAAKVGECR